MRNIAVVTARSSSSRLKNKHFLEINNKSIIKLLIERLKLINDFDDIIISTTLNSDDNKFEEFSKNENLSC